MLIAILAGVLFKMFEEDAVDSLVFIKRNVTFRECLVLRAGIKFSIQPTRSQVPCFYPPCLKIANKFNVARKFSVVVTTVVCACACLFS